MRKVNLFLVIIILGFYSCSSNDNEPITEQETIGESKLVSINDPDQKDMAGLWGDAQFSYSNNKVSNIYGLRNYEVSYKNENLIELTNSDNNRNEKNSIHIENNKVKYILFKITTEYTNETIINKDSILFFYDDTNFLSKVERFYSSSNVTNSKYILDKETDYEMSNGNIVKTKTTNKAGGIITRTYSYDENPNIKFSNFTVENPFNDFGSKFILIYDKLGASNKNNIISVDIDFNVNYTLIGEYKKISFNYELDSNNKLNQILMSGATITTHPSYENTTFTNKVIEFTYE